MVDLTAIQGHSMSSGPRQGRFDMANKAEPVRFAPEASHIPAWDAKHPLFRQFGSATHQVRTARGKTYVEIPAVKDAALREIIAALAAYFTGAFIKIAPRHGLRHRRVRGTSL